MSHPPYRALSFGLRLVSGLVAVAGVLMINDRRQPAAHHAGADASSSV